MFGATRYELLDRGIFQSGQVMVAEMWKYEGIDICSDQNYRQMTLSDDQIEDWLRQKGKFAPLWPSQDAVLEGGIRLLFCDRQYYRPVGFGMSKESYLAMEREFCLPKTTLQSAFHYQGTQSKHFEYSSESPEMLEKIGMTRSFLALDMLSAAMVSADSPSGLVLKAPQKMPIANYILSMSHDLQTGMTTAVIHGAFLHDILPGISNSLLSTPLSHQGRPIYSDSSKGPSANESQSSQILAQLRSSPRHWTNPMHLPILILDNYMHRSNLYAWDLDDKVVDLERQTGVVFAGRTVRAAELKIKTSDFPKEKLSRLTKDMHTTLTEIIHYERSVDWTVDCATFLSKVTCELSACKELPSSKERLAKDNREILEIVDYLFAGSTSMRGFHKALKGRVQAQINVLYSIVAQIDNSLNAKIAVSSARDSTSMKTLAVITTVFLPGTYIATLFSMSMFSWRASSDSSSSDPGRAVSNNFWIYWTVTVPLTVIVVVIWRVWWLYQEKSYMKELSKAMDGLGDHR